MSFPSYNSIAQNLVLEIQKIETIKDVQLASASSYDQVVSSICEVTQTPCVLICFGPSEISDDNVCNTLDIVLLIVMPYECIPGKERVKSWELVHHVSSIFLPQNAHLGKVSMDGVYFTLKGAEPFELEDSSRTVYKILISAQCTQQI